MLFSGALLRRQNAEAQASSAASPSAAAAPVAAAPTPALPVQEMPGSPRAERVKRLAESRA